MRSLLAGFFTTIYQFVGQLFTIFFFILVGLKMTYFTGFIFGALTTLAPLLIFLPFTGQGIFAKNTEIPIKTSLMFLIRHSIYGISMYEGFRWFT